MKKLNWFKRLFMSYEQLRKHFQGDVVDNSTALAVLQEKLNGKDEILQERIARINDLQKELEDKKSTLDKLQGEFERIKAKDAQSTEVNNELKIKLGELEERKTSADARVREIQNEKALLDKEINTKLGTLSKIEKTFFGTTGNKGKGVLGELQLSVLLEKSGLPTNFWVNNLTVGSKTVEFAIRSGVEEKWIPIDSKVLDPEIDEDNEIIMNDAYLKRVETQAKKVAEYTSKKNTAAYALLVLQNDAIYTKMYEYDPVFFQRMIKQNKVHIASPSSFIQFASSVSHIIDIYEKVHEEEVLYKEVISLIDTTTKFGAAIKESYTSMKVAVEKHYPVLERKQNKIQDQLGEEKIKQLASLDEKDKYKK